MYPMAEDLNFGVEDFELRFGSIELRGIKAPEFIERA